MADVTKPSWFWNGGQREIRVVCRNVEVDALMDSLKRANTVFSRDLLAKIERCLAGK